MQHELTQVAETLPQLTSFLMATGSAHPSIMRDRLLSTGCVTWHIETQGGGCLDLSCRRGLLALLHLCLAMLVDVPPQGFYALLHVHCSTLHHLSTPGSGC